MSDTPTPVELNDDLDLFSADFFSGKTPEPASSEEDKSKTVEEESDASPSEDTHSDDTSKEDEHLEEEKADDPESDDDSLEDSADKPKKKNRFQERIDDLTKKQHEAERKAEAALEELRLYKAQVEKQNVTTNQQTESVDGPAPTDTNEDGSDKYPLGEFDPQYVRDLIAFTLQQERKAAQAEDIKAREAAVEAAQRDQLQSEWNTKLEPAQERYPDFLEKAEALVNSFQNLDPGYGDYIAQTIMTMDYGTDVLYYLANNPDEAKRIVNSGAQRAAVSLGRLEAKFALADEEKQKARPKVSQAPEPPSHLNKGSAPAKPKTEPTTDDLEAFEKLFFSKK